MHFPTPVHIDAFFWVLSLNNSRYSGFLVENTFPLRLSILYTGNRREIWTKNFVQKEILEFQDYSIHSSYKRRKKREKFIPVKKCRISKIKIYILRINEMLKCKLYLQVVKNYLIREGNLLDVNIRWMQRNKQLSSIRKF